MFFKPDQTDKNSPAFPLVIFSLENAPQKHYKLNLTTLDEKLSIPETGAVFAFGRSHLTISSDGHDNNYFFIKKDKIKRLICGRNQSAVICGNFMTSPKISSLFSRQLFIHVPQNCAQFIILKRNQNKSSRMDIYAF